MAERHADPQNAPNESYLHIVGAITGPVIHVTGFLPKGIASQQFTLTAKCCDSVKAMTVNLLPPCGKISFVSADNGFEKIIEKYGIIHVAGIKKAEGEETTLTVSVTPDTQADRQLISWEGTTVAPRSDNLRATVPVDIAERRVVRIKFSNKLCKEIWGLPVWVDLTVKIAGALSPENNAESLQANEPRPFGWSNRAVYPETDVVFSD